MTTVVIPTLVAAAVAIWFPYAFVAECVHWDGIDDHSACATLTQREKSVKAVFQIDRDEKLIGIHADRYRDLGNGRFVLATWTGQCSEYHANSAVFDYQRVSMSAGKSSNSGSATRVLRAQALITT
jgi:hypothetical protein